MVSLSVARYAEMRGGLGEALPRGHLRESIQFCEAGLAHWSDIPNEAFVLCGIFERRANPRTRSLHPGDETDLAARLIKRGWAPDDIIKVLGGNWLRVFEEVWGG
jgi:hypothetical protein